MNSPRKHIDTILVARYLSGEMTDTERAAFENWLQEAGQHRDQFEAYRKFWEKLDEVGDIADLDLNREWEQQQSLQNSSTEIISMRPERSRTLLFFTGRLAVAAILALALVFGGLWISRLNTHVSLATADQRQEVTLPDGSVVALNIQSNLRYPRKFKDDSRQVELEGEAFFDVVRDSLSPFVIQTAEVDIKVLGTSFNVNAYRENERVEVTVETGKVAVTHHGEVPRTIIVKPGKQAVFNKQEESLRFSPIVNPNYLSWRTLSFTFEDQTLLQVSRELNKVYGSDIRIPSDSIGEARITTTFEDQTLEAILNVLAATLDLEIRKTDDKLLLVEPN